MSTVTVYGFFFYAKTLYCANIQKSGFKIGQDVHVKQ